MWNFDCMAFLDHRPYSYNLYQDNKLPTPTTMPDYLYLVCLLPLSLVLLTEDLTIIAKALGIFAVQICAVTASRDRRILATTAPEDHDLGGNQ